MPFIAFISYVSVHIFENKYYCSVLLLNLGLHSHMLVLNYRKIENTDIEVQLVKRKGGLGIYDNQIFADYCLSLGVRWSFEKSRRSCSHFVCTCFIVVGTRLSKYRKLPMEVCIFVKYSKLGGWGNIQPINFNLDYYCSTRDIYTFATKLLFNIYCLFLPILVIYSVFFLPILRIYNA